MCEVASNVAIIVHFFLGEECLSGQANLLFFLNVAHHEDGISVVATQDLVQLNVVSFDSRTARVPAHDLFLHIDSAHHVEHLLMVNMVEEPNVWLLWVLLKWHCIAVSDLTCLVFVVAH